MKITNQIRIDAAPEAVWETTLAVENWPTWTPTMTAVRRKADGPLSIGEEIIIKQPGMPEKAWRITTLEPRRRFGWQTRMLGMTMSAIHLLDPTDNGVTNRLEIDISGLMAPILGPLLRRQIAKALEKENLGLKTWCERKIALPE